MDKPIAKKPVYYRYRWHIAGGIAFIVLLIYVGIAASGGRKLRTDAENLIIGEATSDKFLEYVDVEGVVQPILTIQINTREAGSVDRIIAEEGTMMNKGDTILTLNNPDLIRAIEDQQDEWEKQLISYQEKEIEMEQKSIDLQQEKLCTRRRGIQYGSQKQSTARSGPGRIRLQDPKHRSAVGRFAP